MANTDIARQEASNSENLGTLDALSEFFWTTEPTNSRLALVLAEIEGPSQVSDWENALKAVRARYPLLSASITKSPGRRPYFRWMNDEAPPLRLLQVEAEMSPEEMISQELDQSFGLGGGPLGRVVLAHQRERCAVAFVGHHAAFDGRTNVGILRDLVAAASGEALAGPHPLLTSKNELLGLPAPDPGYHKPLIDAWTRSSPPSSLPPARVTNRRVPKEELDVIRERARLEDTTVHAALVTAALIVGRRNAINWRERTVICLSPMDLRPLLGLSDVAGVLTTIHPTILGPSNPIAFWDFARSLKRSMQTSYTLEAARRGALAVKQVVSAEADPYDPTTVDAGGFFDHDIMVSNYGDGALRTQYGRLRLTSLYPAHISGSRPDTQTLSAITMDGILHINHASRAPIAHLLDDVHNVLVLNSK